MKADSTTGFITCCNCKLVLTAAASIKSAPIPVGLQTTLVNKRPELRADDPFGTVSDRATAVQTLWVPHRRSPTATIGVCCKTR